MDALVSTIIDSTTLVETSFDDHFRVPAAHPGSVDRAALGLSQWTIGFEDPLEFRQQRKHRHGTITKIVPGSFSQGLLCPILPLAWCIRRSQLAGNQRKKRIVLPDLPGDRLETVRQSFIGGCPLGRPGPLLVLSLIHI